jgi:radical SAM superfamily enzyme YgiQ (UPF0313 family)
MNILLVFPKINYVNDPKKRKKELLNDFFGESLSLTLPQVAASTPKGHKIEIIDENYEKLDFNVNYDLVGITCFTMSATRAYKIADEFRSKGIPVVLGGTHSTALPEEAKNHADSVIIGEAEISWPKLIEDFEKGELKPFYSLQEEINPELIQEPRRDLIKRQISSDGLLIKRGCPNRCEFCTISSLYSQGVRPLENVIKEIKNIPAKEIFIYDSNLTWHMKYNKKLFKELKNFNKRWQANGTINILGKNEELLKLTKEIGLFGWFIGFESVSQKSLDNIKKKHNKVEDYDKGIKKIKNYGMVIAGSFIFGFDDDTPDIFNNTINALNDWEIDMAEFHILTPFPGTVLFKRLKKEDRLLTEEWKKYTYANVVFKPKNMTIEELFEGTRKVAKNYYSIIKIFKRTFKALETTKNLHHSIYVLQRNFRYRERYKNQFSF